MDVIAIDWSGARSGAAQHIWSAHVRDGELVELGNGRSRTEVVDDLVAQRGQFPGGLTVGLDFAFSLPAWFLHTRGLSEVGQLWRVVEEEGEEWLRDCAPPFWGRPGKRRPELAQHEHFRRCETGAASGGIRAKSVFQIGGAGSVGTGSIRGMPLLGRLREGGFSIWPFDPPSAHRVIEIYPRLLTGPVHKRNGADRIRYLRDGDWCMTGGMEAAVTSSEDAFDAAISALVMGRHLASLAQLGQAADPLLLLEGDVWHPPKITP